MGPPRLHICLWVLWSMHFWFWAAALGIRKKGVNISKWWCFCTCSPCKLSWAKSGFPAIFLSLRDLSSWEKTEKTMFSVSKFSMVLWTLLELTSWPGCKTQADHLRGLSEPQPPTRVIKKETIWMGPNGGRVSKRTFGTFKCGLDFFQKKIENSWSLPNLFQSHWGLV